MEDLKHKEVIGSKDEQATRSKSEADQKILAKISQEMVGYQTLFNLWP
jgi:hypothetical protein